MHQTYLWRTVRLMKGSQPARCTITAFSYQNAQALFMKTLLRLALFCSAIFTIFEAEAQRKRHRKVATSLKFYKNWIHESTHWKDYLFVQFLTNFSLKKSLCRKHFLINQLHIKVPPKNASTITLKNIPQKWIYREKSLPLEHN